MNGVIVFLIVLIEIFGLNFSNFDLTKLYDFQINSSQKTTLDAIDFETISSYPVRNSEFYKIDITGKSFLVYDLGSNRTLLQKNVNSKRPIASITKLMTAVVALENIGLDEKIEISKDVNQVSGSKLWIDPGLNFKTSQLLEGMLIKSANDCAYSVASYWDKKNGKGDFVKEMNQKAEELQMNNTNFDDSSGLSEKNISTASDLKKLSSYAMKNDFIRSAVSKDGSTITSEEGYQFQVYPSNQMLSYDPDIFGIKTGYTEEAGHCFIAGSCNGKDKIVSIILDSGSTTLRFSDSRKLIDWSRSVYNW